jgi:uncharacterized protein
MTTPPPSPVPDLEALLDACRSGAALLESDTHGERHWRAVARAALEITREDDAPDPVVLLLFAVLHDCRRELETRDPEHGPRAADVAVELRRRGLFVITDEQFAQLDEACRLHDTGAVSDDPTIGACYDADRLNLTRLGITPDPAFLSRPIASDPEFIDRCRAYDADPGTWVELASALLPTDR